MERKERDYSYEELERLVKEGLGEDLTEWDRWRAYEFLKEVYGIKDYFLPEEEYNLRISKILEYLNL